jgi:hypothetical protein
MVNLNQRVSNTSNKAFTQVKDSQVKSLAIYHQNIKYQKQKRGTCYLPE